MQKYAVHTELGFQMLTKYFEATDFSNILKRLTG